MGKWTGCLVPSETVKQKDTCVLGKKYTHIHTHNITQYHFNCCMPNTRESSWEGLPFSNKTQSGWSWTVQCLELKTCGEEWEELRVSFQRRNLLMSIDCQSLPQGARGFPEWLCIHLTWRHLGISPGQAHPCQLEFNCLGWDFLKISLPLSPEKCNVVVVGRIKNLRATGSCGWRKVNWWLEDKGFI